MGIRSSLFGSLSPIARWRRGYDSPARVYDEVQLQANGRQFIADLTNSAGVANFVGAAWTGDAVLKVRALWGANPALAAHAPQPAHALGQAVPSTIFLAGLEAIATARVGVGYATLTKALALCWPDAFPMLDSYLMEALWPSEPADPDYNGRESIAGYLARAKLLLGDRGAALAQIVRPPGFPYTDLQVLDRLIWFARYACTRAEFAPALGASWTAVDELPAHGRLVGVPQTVLDAARVVGPSRTLLLPPGAVHYPTLSPGEQATIRGLL